MKRILVSVEGQTEETFVRDVLGPQLLPRQVILQPVLVSTSRQRSGSKFKGGLVSYQQVNREINQLLGDTNAVFVTTFYDLYHLPTDFPGYAARPAGSGQAKAIHLEQALVDAIGSPRFRPYLQVHEFEAFLFVNPEQTAALFPGLDKSDALRKIRQGFSTPEDINDDPNSAPSKRILSLYPQYNKPLDGPLAVLDTGLDALRSECPHFRQWLEWLESLAG